MSRITTEREVAPAAQRFTTTLEHVLPGSCRDLRASDIFRSFKFEFPLWQLPRYPAFCPVNLRQEVLVAVACKHQHVLASSSRRRSRIGHRKGALAAVFPDQLQDLTVGREVDDVRSAGHRSVIHVEIEWNLRDQCAGLRGSGCSQSQGNCKTEE